MSESTSSTEPRVLGLVIHGARTCEPTLRTAVENIREQGHTVHVRVTWEIGDAERFAAELAQQNVDTVIAVGGDGTLNSVVNGLMQQDNRHTGLGLVAWGTANDFATGLNLPIGDPAAALQLILEADPVPIDVGLMNRRYFINMVSGGYGAEITAETSEDLKQLLGGFAYFLTGVAHMTSIEPRMLHLTGPNFDWTGEALALTVGNGRQSGGGYQMAPNALLDDGLLDVTVLKDVSLARYFEVLSELKNIAAEPDGETLIHRQLPWLEVSAPDGLQVNLDGEPNQATKFRFEVLPQRLPCYLPADSPLLKAVAASAGT